MSISNNPNGLLCLICHAQFGISLHRLIMLVPKGRLRCRASWSRGEKDRKLLLCSTFFISFIRLLDPSPKHSNFTYIVMCLRCISNPFINIVRLSCISLRSVLRHHIRWLSGCLMLETVAVLCNIFQIDKFTFFGISIGSLILHDQRDLLLCG